MIGAYGAAHAACSSARERLAAANQLFETLCGLGMSQEGARRAADLDRLLGEYAEKRAAMDNALGDIQHNVELVRALNLFAAAEGVHPAINRFGNGEGE
ncbi:MAG TPA: hypothetical protein VIO94_08765 [Phenylobacterium sp.]